MNPKQFEDLKRAANLLGGAEGFALLKLLSAIEENGNATNLLEYMTNLSETTSVDIESAETA